MLFKILREMFCNALASYAPCELCVMVLWCGVSPFCFDIFYSPFILFHFILQLWFIKMLYTHRLSMLKTNNKYYLASR